MKKVTIPDSLDIVNIKREAKKAINSHGQLRYGQAIYNEANKLFPTIVKTIKNTEFDCYDDDSRVEIFLNKLLGN